MYDIVVIGAGAAGLSAAIYGVRTGLSVLVLESKIYGGQIVNALEVENYPGIKNISGYEFAAALHDQAISLGAELADEDAKKIELRGSFRIVATDRREIECRTIILATGAKNRPLGLENESKYLGLGLSYCATCDGAFFRGKDVAVVGGGNTAVEDALFLSASCKKVYLIHRRDEFRAEANLLDLLRNKPNVEFISDTVVRALVGSELLEGAAIENTKTSEKRELDISGLFIAIGQAPENIQFSPPVELDDYGYIIASEDCKTNVGGIFAAGDCRTKTVRQLVTAASDGAVAALAASAYIKQNKADA